MSKSSSDWKDSRVVIAALAMAGTATFMSTVVLPITTSSLTAKLEALAPAAEKIQSLEKELNETKKKLDAANSIVVEATANTPFLPGSVYPAGLEKVLIGSTRQEVVTAYPSGEWNEDRTYYSVKTDHPHFWRATYYFTRSSNAERVDMILFHLGPRSLLNNEAIKSRFHVLFGPPTAAGRNGRLWWKAATLRESVEMDSDSHYTVQAGARKPLWAK